MSADTLPPLPLIERLRDEADLCRHDGADDVAALLDEAAAALAEQPAPSGIDTLALYRTLCDLTAEANAADTVIGRPRMLYERLAALRDQVGALNSLSLAAPPAPSGWKLVPVEPTHEMLVEFDECQRADCQHGETYWQAMLAAAPTAPAPQPLTDSELDALIDHQWRHSGGLPIYAAHRAFARAVEREVLRRMGVRDE